MNSTVEVHKNPVAAVTIPDMLADTDLLFKLTKQGSDSFSKAQPVPHVLILGAIKKQCCLVLAEGLRAWDGRFEESDKLSSVVQLLLWELNSSTLIRHFASITGSPPLLPDPFLLNGGLNLWESSVQICHSGLESSERHPQTNLKNTLRLEIILSIDPQAECSLEVLGVDDQPLSFQKVQSGALLITESEHYRLRYTCDDPELWCSFVSYYYVNDWARPVSERKLSRGY